MILAHSRRQRFTGLVSRYTCSWQRVSPADPRRSYLSRLVMVVHHAVDGPVRRHAQRARGVAGQERRLQVGAWQPRLRQGLGCHAEGASLKRFALSV